MTTVTGWDDGPVPSAFKALPNAPARWVEADDVPNALADPPSVWVLTPSGWTLSAAAARRVTPATPQ